MDFFAHQEKARRKSSVLLVYFAAAVTGIVASVYVLLRAVYFFAVADSTPLKKYPPFWNGELFCVIFLVVAGLVLVASLYKMAALRAGGVIIASSMGGRMIPPGTTDFKQRRLLNVVEEMALASGVPVPTVFLLGNERGINAFAAGFRPEDAVIGVTQGFLDHLNREQMQGVIAHEFSHILNGDMRLNLHLMGWLHGILFLAILGRLLLESLGRGRSRGKGVAAAAVTGVGLLAIGSIGVFFGKLIKSAISRQREYLADASSVQFTRNPDGLVGALKMIGGLGAGSRIRHPRAEEVSHMYFGNGVREVSGPFATHPPLVERIVRIDATFNGIFPPVKPVPVSPPPEPEKRKPLEAFPKVLPMDIPGTQAAGMAFPVLVAATMDVQKMIDTIGVPTEQHVEAARRLVENIPDALKEAVRDPLGAAAAVYAYVLDEDPVVRARQGAILEASQDAGLIEEINRVREVVSGLAPEMVLPMIDLCLPALSRLSPPQYAVFKKTVKELTEADQEITLTEYTLRHVLYRYLDSRILKPKTAFAQIYNVRGLLDEVSRLLSLMAWLGQDDEAEARKAFGAGEALLRAPRVSLQFLAEADCGLASIDRALDRIDMAAPRVKRQVVSACFLCLNHDQKITLREAELFRAVAAALGVPIPPWIVGEEERAEEMVDG